MRRLRWPVLAAGLLALAAMVALRAADPEPVQGLRLRAFDAYQRIKPRPSLPDLPVRVVEVDEAALRALGQWPWPRDLLADLVDRLTQLGAATVGFDVVFAERDRTSPRQLLHNLPRSAEAARLTELLQALPDHDEALAASFAAGRVVGAMALLSEASGGGGPPAAKASFAYGGSDPLRFVVRYGGAVRDLPALAAASAGAGSITFMPDGDGIVRRVPLLQAVGEQLVPGFSAECLRVAQGASTIMVRAADAGGAFAFGAPAGLTAMKIGRFVVPVTRRGELWLWYGGERPGRSISAARLFEPDWPALRSRFEGQIVLVGASAQGLRDQRTTPLADYVPGVRIHAEAVEQMIAGQFLVRPDWAEGAELAMLLAAGLLFVLLLPAVGPVWSAALGGTVGAAGVAASWTAFDRFGLLLDPVYPALAAAVVYLAMTTARFVFSERERARVRRAFGHYLAPSLVKRLAEQPEALRLGGESRQLTLLFADIRGFTALSERLLPDELTRRLNDFLTPMTDALLAEGATIDKYMGDAVMAFWNAPISQPDHAERALRGALAMRGRLGSLAVEWAAEDRAAGREPVELRFGLGINTGNCVVGNMGSKQRFDYSAIGDPVNLTARLEGLSKVYGLDVLVGEATAAQAFGFALVEIDRVRVMGRRHAVAIYALLGDESLAEGAAFLDFRQRHEAALAAYRGGDWDTAAAAFAELGQSADPLLRPYYPVMAARVATYRVQPPPGWDGTYEAERK